MGGINIFFNVSCWRAQINVHHDGMGHDVLYMNPYGTLRLLSGVLYLNCNCGYIEQDHVEQDHAAEPVCSEQGLLCSVDFVLLLTTTVFCLLC